LKNEIVAEHSIVQHKNITIKNVGFSKRIVALVIDISFLNAIWYFWEMWDVIYVSESLIHYSLSSAGQLVFLGYYLVLEMTPLQATLGKYILDIKVTNKIGKRIGIGENIMRNIGRFCTVCTIFLGFFLILIRHDKKSLSELISDTYVCSTKA